jgi:hypothetical protein
LTKLSSKHIKTLGKIFIKPPLASIPWKDVESLFKAMGSDISEGDGSRIHIALNGEVATFHRPHPQKETDKGAIKSVQRFLENAGILP